MPDLRSTIDTVRRDGRERTIRCPAHDDRRASLAVGRGDDGRVLLHCHAGCATDVVLEAAGLTMADLHERRAGHEHTSAIVATYDYRDERGTLLYQVVRMRPKTFRQRRPNGAGGWTWRLDDVRRVLYRLPELRGQKVAYIAEGEKDADRLAALGLAATTNAGGAGKWRDEYAEQLRAAGVEAVVILPDNDEPGRAHGEAVARSCHRAGFKVNLVTLPGLPAKGDVSNWLDAGHTGDELIATVKGTDLYLPTTASDRAPLQLTALADLLAEPDEHVQFLVAERIAVGSLNLLAGKPKSGKSTAARVLAFEVGRGGSWLGFSCLARPVWYLALEDKRSEIRRHFRQMGATGAESVRFIFPTDRLLDQVRALAAQERPGLIIVDTLQRLIGARDLNDYAEVTTRLTPILALARDTGAAVLLVHHAGKSDRPGIDAVLGSTALAGSVDNVFMLSRTDRYRALASVQRIGPDLPETVLTLDETGRVDAGPTRHDADVQEVERALVEALRGGPQLRADLLDAVDARRQTKLEALRAAVARGTVIRSGAGTKADPHRFCLPADSGSQVPHYRREPESSQPETAETPNVFGSDSGSRDHETAGTGIDGREPESEPRVRALL